MLFAGMCILQCVEVFVKKPSANMDTQKYKLSRQLNCMAEKYVRHWIANIPEIYSIFKAY